MKILFVIPINRSYVIAPSLGLGYLASIARKSYHQVTILDCKRERMNYEGFRNYIRENHFDLIGFQVFSYDLSSIKKHIEITKNSNKKTIVVAGGAHPSGVPKETMLYLGNLDFAFKGEGEIGFSKFLDFLEKRGFENLSNNYEELQEIPGLVFRNTNGDISINEPAYVENLDDLDFPSWDLMNPKEYPEAPHGAFARQFPTAPIIITRGCPYSCTFCAGKSITGSKVRKRSIDNVWTEIQYLTERFGVKELLIEDENFTLHKNLLRDFCLKLINSRQKLSWSFPSGVRLETLNSDNIKLMEEAGCYSMAVGIEFGSQRIQDLTKKRLTIKLIEEKIALLSKSKIKITGFFMLGITGEKRADILSTINLALRLAIDRAQFNNFMPLPGSELWYELTKNGKLMDINWDRFFVHDVSYVAESLSHRELKQLQRLAYLKFYLRPKIIYKLLKEIRSFRHGKMLLNRFFDALS